MSLPLLHQYRGERRQTAVRQFVQNDLEVSSQPPTRWMIPAYCFADLLIGRPTFLESLSSEKAGDGELKCIHALPNFRRREEPDQFTLGQWVLMYRSISSFFSCFVRLLVRT